MGQVMSCIQFVTNTHTNDNRACPPFPAGAGLLTHQQLGQQGLLVGPAHAVHDVLHSHAPLAAPQQRVPQARLTTVAVQQTRGLLQEPRRKKLVVHRMLVADV